MLAKVRLDSLKGYFQGRQGTGWLLCGIFLLALLLRLYPLENLNHGSLGPSEGFIVTGAAAPFFEIPQNTPPDLQSLKYYFLHIMLYFGRSELLLILPSLICDLASILLLFYLGTLLFEKKAGLWASFLMAISLWHIHYATNIRNYPLYYFSMLASTIFLCRAVKTSRTRDWNLFAITSALGYYSFFPSLFFLAVQIGWFFIFYGKRRDLVKRMFLSLGLFAILVAPVAGRLAGAYEHKRNFGASMGREMWGSQGRELWSVLRNHFSGVEKSYGGIFIFILSFIWIFFFQKKKAPALLLLMLIVVPSSFYAFCNFAFRISVAPRYFLTVYPFFLLIVAAGIASFPYWAGRVVAGLVFLLPLCLYGLFQTGLVKHRSVPYDYLVHQENAEAIASMIESHQDSLDFVMVKPMGAIYALQYYLDKANRSPIIEMDGIFGKRYLIFENRNILFLGSDGDFPLLKRLAATGRLLVVGFSRQLILGGDDVLLPWLQANAYRMEHFSDTDAYFISSHISGDPKESSAMMRRELLEGRVVRRFIYPFNRKK